VLSVVQLPGSVIQSAFAEASYRAISTMVFISAEMVIPRVVEQLHMDINPAIINAVTETELGIWATPDGETFFDGIHFLLTYFPV
jgi:hypothetical protein